MGHHQQAICHSHDQHKQASSQPFENFLVDLVSQTYKQDHVSALHTPCNVSHRLFFLQTLVFGPN